MHKLQEAKDENGLAASPVLSKDIKNYLIDIDGTITEDVPNESQKGWLHANHFLMH